MDFISNQKLAAIAEKLCQVGTDFDFEVEGTVYLPRDEHLVLVNNQPYLQTCTGCGSTHLYVDDARWGCVCFDCFEKDHFDVADEDDDLVYNILTGRLEPGTDETGRLD